ncbi:MAG: hypothetical protein SWQ30_04385 [Thermodesulfobacteriota bacterium]|nr:hypothetical protein [Thermodesulfobacteriota bacterium]
MEKAKGSMGEAMKGVRLVRSYLVAVVMIILSGGGVCAEYHHVDDCSVCHYAGLDASDCTGSANLVHIRDLIDTPCGDLTQTVFGPFVVDVPPYNGVCQVCHDESGGACSTKYYRHDGTGDDHPVYKSGSMGPTDCNACHLHAPHEFGHQGSVGTGCDACHGQEGQSHSTHTESDIDDLKGPNKDCDTCHDTDNYPYFADGATTLAATTVCDNCHSSGGAYDGVNDPVLGAKASWDSGVYESDGATLKEGKERWCASCHDADPAYSQPYFETIVDDREAAFTTGWSFKTDHPEQYRDRFGYTEAVVGGTRTCTWIPDISEAGDYKVFAWWVDNPAQWRCVDVPYTINYDGGSETVRVDQTDEGPGGGKWNYLGEWSFAQGTSGSIVISNDATPAGVPGETSFVTADAVLVVKSNGNPWTPGVYAPNISGDNLTYGFYATGHGANGRVECLDCHVASKAHIDHNHRTYEVDEVADPDVVVNPYCDSYRLEDDAMYLPRDYRLGGISRKAFDLCFDCHNYHEILGEDMNLMSYGIQWDYSHTNFWDASSSYTEIGNAHYYHLRRSDYTQIDSDWDGARDSRASCISCHNVHGPPNRAMIRHGELISKPGTTDKVPALNFAYLDDPTEPPATATWETPDPLNGTYEVYAHWQAWDNRAPDATYTVHYDDGGPATDPVTVDQTVNGGVWNLLGTYSYSGSNGKVVLDNVFTYTIPLKQAVGADAIQWIGPTTVIVDDTSATYVDDYSLWNYQTGTFEALNGDWHYIHPHMTTPNAATTLANSKGGITDYTGFYVSDTNLCKGCHTGTDTRYDREPKLWPRVITMPGAQPDVIYIGSGISSTITVTVVDPDDNVSTVTIDLTPIGGSSTQSMIDNGDDTYSYTVNGLDTYPDQPITFEITATDLDANTGTGLVTIFIYEPGGIYIDDRSAVFTLGWYYGMVHPEQYLICFRYTEAEIGGTRTCTWTPNVPQAGNYEVSAWWIDNPAPWRCVDVPYTINYNGGSETVRVDQTDAGPGGGQWNLLGTWNFAQGTSGTVVISNDATPAGVPGETSFVTADAVKLVPVP